MSRLSQFLGNAALKPKSIVNVWSGGTLTYVSLSSFPTRAATVLSGAMTASTLKTVLSISGRGAIGFLAFRQEDSTARTMRIRITLDGTVIFDSSAASAAAANQGQTVIGEISGSNILETLMTFDAQLLIEASSSATETDKMRFAYAYYTR